MKSGQEWDISLKRIGLQMLLLVLIIIIIKITTTIIITIIIIMVYKPLLLFCGTLTGWRLITIKR